MDPQNKLPMNIQPMDMYYQPNIYEYNQYTYPIESMNEKKEQFDYPQLPHHLNVVPVEKQIDESLRSTIEYYIIAYMQSYSMTFEEILNTLYVTPGMNKTVVDYVVNDLERKAPNLRQAYRMRMILTEQIRRFNSTCAENILNKYYKLVADQQMMYPNQQFTNDSNQYCYPQPPPVNDDISSEQYNGNYQKGNEHDQGFIQ